MGPWCGQMGIAGWVGMIAVWAVVVGALIWGVSRLFPARNVTEAHAALDQRLVRGEIDAETYRLIRDELDGLRPAGTRGAR